MKEDLATKHWEDVKVPFLDYNDALGLLYTRDFFRWSQATDKEKKDLIEKTITYLTRCYYLEPEELILYRSKVDNQNSSRKDLDDFYSLTRHLIDLSTIVLEETERLKNIGVIKEWMQKKIVDSVSGLLNATKTALASFRESITS